MSFHIKIESIHFLRICILTSLLTVPYQVRAQEYFQMKVTTIINNNAYANKKQLVR